MRSFVIAAALVLLGSTAGCSGDDDGDPQLSFDFESIAPSGFIDQTITITNPGDQAVTATFTITPLDERGEPVPGVQATTALGSAAGQMVLVPGENVDFLRLEGRRVHDVEDIAVQEVSTVEVDFPDAESAVLVDRWEQGDRELTIDNPNEDALTVAVALLVYDVPAPGEPQQVVDVVDLVAPTTVERGRDHEVSLVPGALRALNFYFSRAPTSEKAYFTR
jgi:hypothetical protein